MCGLEIRIKGDEIVGIQGHKEDIYSKGHICPKGVALKDLHEAPNWLREPVKKTANGWETISWEEACNLVETTTKNEYANSTAMMLLPLTRVILQCTIRARH